MKLVKSNVELIEQGSGLEGVYRQIEQAGRTCYKSEDKITEDSAKEFVQRMMDSGHLAMLEHGTVYLMLYTVAPEDWDEVIANHPRITIDDARDYMRAHPTYNNEGEENWWVEDASYIAYKMVVKYTDNPYSKVKIIRVKHEINTKEGYIITSINGLPKAEKATDKMVSVFNAVLITTNLRVLVENNWLDDLKYICEPTEYHAERITMKFTIDRGVSHKKFVA